MAYSRWSNSVWYTYWSTQNVADQKQSKNTQLFVIDTVITFTYKELKEDIANCIAQVRACYSNAPKNNANSAWCPSKEEIIELEGYMKEFILDVEKEGDAKANFIKTTTSILQKIKIPEKAAYILAILIIADPSYQSFEQLVELTHFAQASLKNNLYYLEQLGYIEKISKPDQETFYILSEKIWKNVIQYQLWILNDLKYFIQDSLRKRIEFQSSFKEIADEIMAYKFECKIRE